MIEIIIDVREQDEFNAESIEGSVHIPLSHFDSVGPGTLSHFMDRKVVLMCRSGARAKMAHSRAVALGFQPSGGYEIFQGGILEWKKQGRPMRARRSNHLSILRQTHIAAGLSAMSGTVLGYLAHPGFYALTGFVGAGLTFAGISGICIMSNALAVMPWNRNVPSVKQEVCVASSGNSNCENL